MKSILTIILVLTCSYAHAEVYKWTDKNGVVHYEDKQPSQAEKVAPTAVEKMNLPTPPVISSTSSTPTGEDTHWWTPWIAKAETLRDDLLQRLDRSLEKTPVITNQTIIDNEQNKTEAKLPNVVEIYTAAWCGVCKKAKRWLDDRGVAYKEYDVEKDAAAAVRMRELGGGNGVPFAVINGKKFRGFDKAGYQAALH